MKKCAALLLFAAMLVCLLAGCQEQDAIPPVDTTPVNRTLTVQFRSGAPVQQATVAIYRDSGLTDLAFAGKTDDSGSFSYTAPATEPYYAVLSGLPAGLAADDNYLLSKDTEITLKMAVMTDEDMSNVTYSLGDAMHDFTVTDYEGNSYTLSKLLQEKDAVILNFWFMGCAPCKNEFPHLQAAYESYSDKIAVLALNCVDSDNEEIAQFKASNGYSFVMTKADVRWCEMFQVEAFPLTVVIDRYGEIALMHTGAMDTEGFTEIFEAYTAD